MMCGGEDVDDDMHMSIAKITYTIISNTHPQPPSTIKNNRVLLGLARASHCMSTPPCARPMCVH